MKSSLSIYLSRQLIRYLFHATLFATLLLGSIILQTATGISQELSRLKVSDNHRYLVSDNGKPFF